MAAAQAESARDAPRDAPRAPDPEAGGWERPRELPSYQSEAQLPRKPTPATDMD